VTVVVMVAIAMAIVLVAIAACPPSAACSFARSLVAVLLKNAKYAGRPSSVSNFHEAAGQVLGGDVAATFGDERDAREGSPEGRTSGAMRCSAPHGAEPSTRSKTSPPRTWHADQEKETRMLTTWHAKQEEKSRR
jgi:hypothetical protein